MFRDLLVHVDGSDGGRRRVRFAVALAERSQSRLSGLHVTPPSEVPVQFKPSRVAQIEEEISISLELDALTSTSIFREEADHLGPDVLWSRANGDVVDGVCDKARYADLVILGQYESQGRPENHPLPIAHSVVTKCGRPVLVIPRMASADAMIRAAVMWDRSRESIRAIHDALPLLRLWRSVQVVVVDPKPGTDSALDTQSLMIHLARHGIAVEPDIVKVTAHEAFTRQIESGGYDLLVIGGSSTPTWVNFLFGDVTQSVLLSSTVPVFVSQ